MRTLIAVVLVAVLVAGMTAVWACSGEEEIVIYGTYEEVPSVGWWPPDASGMVAVGSVPFFVIPGNGGGLPLAMRAEIVDTRITEIISDGIIRPVYVGAVRGQPTIYVGPYRLITVYDIDAVNAGATSAQVLAEKWAAGTAAALPQVTPSPYAAPSAGQQVGPSPCALPPTSPAPETTD